MRNDLVTTPPQPSIGSVGHPAFLDTFAAMHDAMRRDSRRLPLAVGRTTTPASAGALLAWYQGFRSAIEHHHTREDDTLWPELERRSPGFAAEAAELAVDHERLDEALAAASATLGALADGSGDRASATTAAEALRDLLVDHLAREEAAAFGRIATSYTAEEYAAVEAEMRKGMRPSELAFVGGWMLDGRWGPAVPSWVGGLPRPLRLAMRFAFVPRYRRLAAPLLVVAP